MNLATLKPPKKKYPRLEALEVAAELMGHLSQGCILMAVAGSLRRNKENVGDVEILYVPLVQLEFLPRETDLFGLGPKTEVDLAAELLERLLSNGIISMRWDLKGRQTWGTRNRLARHSATGIPVDFFSATSKNWWNYLVCRTGPALSNIAICQAAKAKGWKWHPYAEGFTDAEGVIHPAMSEEHVFELAGLPYREPHER